MCLRSDFFRQALVSSAENKILTRLSLRFLLVIIFFNSWPLCFRKNEFKMGKVPSIPASQFTGCITRQRSFDFRGWIERYQSINTCMASGTDAGFLVFPSALMILFRLTISSFSSLTQRKYSAEKHRLWRHRAKLES